MKITFKLAPRLSPVLISAIIVSLLFGNIRVNARDKMADNIGLEKEIAQRQDVLNRFLKAGTGDIVYENPEIVGKDYVPEGSQCTDVSVLGDVVYIDYRIKGMRYLVAYYKDGMVEKAARAVNGKEVYSIDSRSNRVESFRADAISQTLSITDKEAMRN